MTRARDIANFGDGIATADIGDGQITTAKIADGDVTSAKLFSGFANGVTMTDQWRLNTDFNVVTSEATVNSGWERVDDTSAAFIGSSLTESSGVFSFPETGIYLINFQGRFYHDNGANLFAYLMLKITEDNSTYDNRNTVLSAGYATNSYSNVAGFYVMDVTDISNFKFSFAVRSQANNAKLQGTTTATNSGFTIMRIGDT